MTRILAILTSLALTACGGGGSDFSTPSTVPQVPVCDIVLIQQFGDSTMEQQFDAMQKIMDAKFGPGVVVVENYGLSGETADRFPAGKVKRGAIVVVNYGINDIRTPGTTVESYKANLRATEATFYQTPNPTIDGYAQAMREVAAETSAAVIDVSAYVHSLPNWEIEFPDRVHPSPYMYGVINEYASRQLIDAVRAKRAACGVKS